MKRMIAMLLCLVLLLSLCACGAAQEEETQGKTTTGDAETENAQTQPSGTEEMDDKALAESCIGKPVEELYALIGQPESADYAPSCLNPGEAEDGLLDYGDFVVYTIKDANGETVDYVE